MSKEMIDDFLMLGAHLIQKTCSYLKLPSSTCSLAQIYLHSFYLQNSANETDKSIGHPVLLYSLLDISMGSILLAAKASESHRRVRDIVNMSYYLFHKLRRVDFIPMPYVCDSYFSWRERVTKAEILILRALSFETHFLLPQGLLVNYLKALDLLQVKKVCQVALNYVNDAFRHPALALKSAPLIACVALKAACQDYRVELPKDWNLVFDVSHEELKYNMRYLDRIYRWRFNPDLPITPAELQVFAEEYNREFVYMKERMLEKSRRHQKRRSPSPIPVPSFQQDSSLNNNHEYASLYSDFSSSPGISTK